jgi:acyl CoA:acetate/3-ketoacid CoA transferase
MDTVVTAAEAATDLQRRIRRRRGSALYVTERCVFQLTAGGLELIEIAPWVDLEKDIVAHIGFEPISWVNRV